jgi:hypothetical protein
MAALCAMAQAGAFLDADQGESMRIQQKALSVLFAWIRV